MKKIHGLKKATKNNNGITHVQVIDGRPVNTFTKEELQREKLLLLLDEVQEKLQKLEEIEKAKPVVELLNAGFADNKNKLSFPNSEMWAAHVREQHGIRGDGSMFYGFLGDALRQLKDIELRSKGALKKPQIHHYLNKRTLKQCKKITKSVLLQKNVKGNRVVVPCQYASILVPVNENGTIDKKYIKGWGKLLNRLEKEGVFRDGALCPFGVKELTNHDGKRCAALYSFVFNSKSEPPHAYSSEEVFKRLNKIACIPVFTIEGEVSQADCEKLVE